MSIWSNQQFSRFFAAFSLTTMGDWFDIFALQIIFVKFYHASPMLIGALVLVYFLPGMLLGSFVGSIADRFSKRKIMILADSLSCVLTFILFFSAHALLALLLVFMRSSLATLTQPTVNAYIKAQVDEQHLLKATSYMSMAFQLSKALGPMIGASLLVVISPQQCILINALSFAFSAAIMWTVAADKPVQQVGQPAGQAHWLTGAADGFKALRLQPDLLALLGISFFWFMTSIACISQMSIYLTHLLPHRLSSLGYIIGLDGLGAVLTSIVLSRIKDIEQYFAFMAAGFGLQVLGVASFAVFQPDWPMLVLYIGACILGVGSSINILVYSLMLRKLSPKQSIGRVSGVFVAVQNTAQLIGAIGGGLVITLWGVRSLYEMIFMVMAALVLLSLWLAARFHQSVHA